jgi:pimeloyl-ACP methyl ester carboxylesterase
VKPASLGAIARELGIDFPDDAPAESRFVVANGIEMHYLDWGGSGRPVVFLHGGGFTAQTWDLVCLGLRGEYRCVALDLRGHGLSGGLHAFGVEQPRDDLRAFVQALDLKEPALVGMSLGGNNAIAYAGVHSQELAAVVFVDVCPSVQPEGYRDEVERAKAFAKSASLDEAVEHALRLNPRGSRAYKRHTLSHVLEPRDGAQAGFRMRHQREGAPKSDAAAMEARKQALWALVPKITCPALVVHGAESRAQTRAGLEAFRSLLPNADLVEIAGASHYVQEDQPRALLAELRRFFGGLIWADRPSASRGA